jgi:hypothetical protein
MAHTSYPIARHRHLLCEVWSRHESLQLNREPGGALNQITRP